MWLLNAKDLKLEVFWGDVPPYVILSHTWLREDEEPTCQDIKNGTKKDTPGYLKIEACCKKALEQGYRYVWVDTCCIDKTNNVELAEAINSMFNWYKGATICYAYLADYRVPAGLPPKEHKQAHEEAFSESKWFTRGWTLQELIAPETLVFYSHDWKSIGSKTDMCDLVSKITRISPRVLKG